MLEFISSVCESRKRQNKQKLFCQAFECPLPATYPRVLPASRPKVSEPDRNQGGSLVLPGLEVLPVPEPLLNFELETKDRRLQLQELQPQILGLLSTAWSCQAWLY